MNATNVEKDWHISNEGIALIMDIMLTNKGNQVCEVLWAKPLRVFVIVLASLLKPYLL